MVSYATLCQHKKNIYLGGQSSLLPSFSSPLYGTPSTSIIFEQVAILSSFDKLVNVCEIYSNVIFLMLLCLIYMRFEIISLVQKFNDVLKVYFASFIQKFDDLHWGCTLLAQFVTSLVIHTTQTGCLYNSMLLLIPFQSFSSTRSVVLLNCYCAKNEVFY